MTAYRVVVLLIFFTFLSACASNQEDSDSSWINATGGGFVLIGSQVSYAMNYELGSPLQRSAMARFEFQNPAGGSINSEQRLAVGQNKIVVQSPVLPCVINRALYLVELEIEQSDGVKHQHRQALLFDMSATTLLQRGVKLCPPPE